MSSATWRSVFTFNKYSQITARARRNAGLTALRYQTWEDGVGSAQTTLNPEMEKDPKKSYPARLTVY
ncbi:hypothetical protein FB45DRAFT_1135432 [Roridomyces roridus]|uniref:Uncharacterized protein n=1 Tax=Roridomyces roridus TaxID=1738132 RepID=A0AAD7B1S3_9AGAR|nr:hypothetical protein FB45DRAFT_1135432 [Roridomyces roridus]